MKYCNQCGRETPEGVRFCPFCGAQQTGGAPAQQRRPGRAAAPDPTRGRRGAAAAPKKRGLKWWYIALPLLVAALVAGALFWFLGKDKTAEEPDRVSFDGHYYKLYPSGTVDSWEDAQAFCEKKGGYLATINSQAENDFLYDYIRGEDCLNAYFGFTDRDSEGVWTWITGETTAYSNWCAGEPNNALSGENYAMLFFRDGAAAQWFDGDFGKESDGGSAFLCEWGDHVTQEDVSYYTAYDAIVSERQETYGEGRYVPADALMLPDMYTMEGVGIVRLMDLNNDGIDELLLGYQKLDNNAAPQTVEVWTISNGEAMQLYQGGTSGIGDIGSGCLFLIRLDGEWLMRDGTGTGNDWDIRYLGIRDDAFAELHSLHSVSGSEYLLDGQSVSSDDYFETAALWAENSVYYRYLSDQDEAGLIRETQAVCARLKGAALQPDEAPQTSDAPEPTAAPQAQDEASLYAATIAEFSDYMRRLRSSSEAEDAMNEMVDKHYSYVYRYRPESCGYALLDVNGDGVKELLIGDSAENILDLFTIVNGQVVHVYDSGERYMLTLGQDGLLRVIASSSAFHTEYVYYTLQGGQLALREAYVFDKDYGEQSGTGTSCYCVKQEPISPENGTPIAEDEAHQIIDSRPSASISYTLFT